MIVDRGGPGKALCDMCQKNKGTQVHEMISRGRTIKNDTARSLSYNKHLCAWLCQDCHNKAHSPKKARVLLLNNINKYGREAVKAAYDAVVDAMKLPLNIPFPEE
jgi:hypothetical protein